MYKLFKLPPSFVLDGELVNQNQDLSEETKKKAVKRLIQLLDTKDFVLSGYDDSMPQKHRITDSTFAVALTIGDIELKLFEPQFVVQTEDEQDYPLLLLESTEPFIQHQGWLIGFQKFKVNGKNVERPQVVAVRNPEKVEIDFTVDSYMDFQFSWLMDNIMMDFHENFQDQIVEDHDDGD